MTTDNTKCAFSDMPGVMCEREHDHRGPCTNTSVAPASLAAEQRPFAVGDWVSGTGCSYGGSPTGVSHVGRITELHAHVAAVGIWFCLLDSLRHESPPPAKRPECSTGSCKVCGQHGCEETPRPCVNCGAQVRCENVLTDDGKGGWFCCADVCRAAYEKIRAKPSEPGRHSCDGCELARSGGAFRSTDDEGRVRCLECGKVSLRSDDAIAAIMMRRDAALPPKRRQALDQLLRPVERKYEAHPASFPEDAFLDAWSCEP